LNDSPLHDGDPPLAAGDADVLDVLVWVYFVKFQECFGAGEGRAAADWPFEDAPKLNNVI
jgi:hypothetical protein